MHQGLYQFNFFTYDSRGVDTIVPIMAECEDDAWEKFRRTHRDSLVDQITQGTLSHEQNFVPRWTTR